MNDVTLLVVSLALIIVTLLAAVILTAAVDRWRMQQPAPGDDFDVWLDLQPDRPAVYRWQCRRCPSGAGDDRDPRAARRAALIHVASAHSQTGARS